MCLYVLCVYVLWCWLVRFVVMCVGCGVMLCSCKSVSIFDGCLEVCALWFAHGLMVIVDCRCVLFVFCLLLCVCLLLL